MQKKYDVLVVGGGIAGLSAALHCAHYGCKTLLVEKQDHVGGKAAAIYEQGFTFDPGPSICIMKWVYEDIITSTKADPQKYIRFDRLDPIFSLIPETGDPLLLPAGKDAFLATIQKYAPHDVAGFERLFLLSESLYPTVKKTFFAKSYSSLSEFISRDTLPFVLHPVLIRKYKDIIDDWFHDPVLRAWLYSFPTYTGQTYHAIAPGALLIPYIMICEGVYYPQGGIHAIPNALEQRARELGVDIVTNCMATKIHTEGSTVVDVDLSSGDRVCPRVVISAIDQFATREIAAIPSQPSASYSYVSLQLGIHKRFKHLTHHTSCIPTDYESYYKDLYDNRVLPEDPVIYIHAPSATHTECAPKDHESLFCVIPTHACGADWPKVEKDVEDKILAILAKYNIHIDTKDIRVSRIQTPAYFQKTHGNFLGSLFGPAESQRLLQILPSPAQDPQIANLLYAGGGVQPGAGMPMVALSGKIAATIGYNMI